jgi:hypothetical protein
MLNLFLFRHSSLIPVVGVVFFVVIGTHCVYCDGSGTLGSLTLSLPQPAENAPVADFQLIDEDSDSDAEQEEIPQEPAKPSWTRVVLKTAGVIILGVTTIIVAGYIVPKLADATVKQAKETSKMWSELLRA